MTDSLGRGIRQSGILSRLHQPHDIRRARASAQVYDDAGRLLPEQVAALQTERVMDWGPADTRKLLAYRAGTAVLIAAYAETPPSSGNCVVTVTMITTLSGAEVIGRVQITRFQSFGSAEITYPVPRNARIGAAVTTPSGASGVHTSLVIKAGTA